MSRLMEEIVAKSSRYFGKFSASLGVFLFAIGFGMHVAGQTPAPNSQPSPNVAPLQAATAGSANSLPSASAGASTPTLPAGAPPPAAGVQQFPGMPTEPAAEKASGDASAAAAQKLAPFMPSAGSIPKDKMPAFGPAAIQAADELDGFKADKATKKETKPEKFVPSVVEQIQAKKVQQADPRAVLHTSMGDITIHLFPNYTPKTVHNFIDLARGDREFLDAKTGKPTRRPFYTELVFHRVMEGFLIQTGCPFGTGHGGPGYFISDEITPALRFSKPGMVAMAPERRDSVTEKKDANGSQFFISLAAMPEWDDKFTIFGEVEKGMKVVEKIAHVQTGPTDRPIRRVYLNSVEIFEDAAPSAGSNDR